MRLSSEMSGMRWVSFTAVVCLTICAFGAEAFGEDLSSEDSKWFLIYGAANVQPKLESSEAKIAKDINGLFGAVLPRWEEPRTFKDWKHELRMWDFHIGLGRDLGEKWAWVSTIGGTAGKVRNSDRYYPLAIPLMINVDFSRELWFASTGLLYYPWGKADFTPSPDGKGRFMRSLKGTRPFVGGILGYVGMNVRGDVKIGLPIIKDNLKIVDEQSINVFYASPRIGIDIPLTKRDELCLAAGYLFFDNHGDDVNNASYYMLFKHRFAAKKKS